MIFVNHGSTIKKIESAKSVKSVMSFFIIPFRHFQTEKAYIFLIYYLFIPYSLTLLSACRILSIT